MLLDPIPAPEGTFIDGIDLAEIEEKLRKAHRGNWFTWRLHDGNSDIIWAEVDSVVGEDCLCSNIPDDTADYIMATQPRVMKRFILRLKRAEGPINELLDLLRGEIKFWADHCRVLEQKVQDLPGKRYLSTSKLTDMSLKAIEEAADLKTENEILKAQGAIDPDDEISKKLIAEVFERRGAWNTLQIHTEKLGLLDNQVCARAECDRKELASWRSGESLPSVAQARIIDDRCAMNELWSAIKAERDEDE